MKSREHFGQLVATELGYPEPITSVTVGRWETEQSVPDIFVLDAIAKLAGLDPGWVAFGSGSAAPAPVDAMEAEIDAVGRQKWERVVSPEWNKRFVTNLSMQKAAQRIVDEDERERELEELDAQFKQLMEELSTRLKEKPTRKPGTSRTSSR